jgi:hypothetical protein
VARKARPVERARRAGYAGADRRSVRPGPRAAVSANQDIQGKGSRSVVLNSREIDTGQAIQELTDGNTQAFYARDREPGIR